MVGVSIRLNYDRVHWDEANLRFGGLISVLNSQTLSLMIIWLEEAYGIDEPYKVICQILATDGTEL